MKYITISIIFYFFNASCNSKSFGFVKKDIELSLELNYYPQDLDWRFGESLEQLNFDPNFLAELNIISNMPDTSWMEAFSCNEFKSIYVDAYVVTTQNDDWFLQKMQPVEFLSSEKIMIMPRRREHFIVGLGPLQNGDCILIQPYIDFPPYYIRLPAFGGQFGFVREPYAFFRYYDDSTDVFLPEFEDCTDSMTFEIHKNLK